MKINSVLRDLISHPQKIDHIGHRYDCEQKKHQDVCLMNHTSFLDQCVKTVVSLKKDTPKGCYEGKEKLRQSLQRKTPNSMSIRFRQILKKTERGDDSKQKIKKHPFEKVKSHHKMAAIDEYLKKMKRHEFPRKKKSIRDDKILKDLEISSISVSLEKSVVKKQKKMLFSRRKERNFPPVKNQKLDRSKTVRSFEQRDIELENISVSEWKTGDDRQDLVILDDYFS